MEGALRGSFSKCIRRIRLEDPSDVWSFLFSFVLVTADEESCNLILLLNVRPNDVGNERNRSPVFLC